MAGSMRLVRGDDVWELRVYLGRDADGKVRHRYVRFTGTRRAAERALARMLIEVEDNPAPVPTQESRQWDKSTTINGAIEGWRANGWDDLSPSTTLRYQNLWKTHIERSIGRRRLIDTSPYDIEQFFRSLKAKGLSKASVQQARAILHRACRLARKWSNNTLPNPVAGTELPAWNISDSREVRAPSNDEVLALLAAAFSHDRRFHALLRVVAATGMRRGETCGLRWADIDFLQRTIRISQSIVAATGGAKVKAPKTRASIRTVAVDQGTMDELAWLRNEQDALASSCGASLDAEGFVFAAEPGGVVPLHPDTVSKTFAAVRKEAGVAADLHLHSLRHFHATVLDPIISEAQKQARLGWATVRMSRHYTDSVPEEDRRAAEHVGELLRVSPARRGRRKPA